MSIQCVGPIIVISVIIMIALIIGILGLLILVVGIFTCWHVARGQKPNDTVLNEIKTYHVPHSNEISENDECIVCLNNEINTRQYCTCNIKICINCLSKLSKNNIYKCIVCEKLIDIEIKNLLIYKI